MATDSGDVAMMAPATVGETHQEEDNNNKIDLVADTVAKLNINGTGTGDENGETETKSPAEESVDEQENQLNNNTVDNGTAGTGSNSAAETTAPPSGMSIGKRIRRTSEKLNEDTVAAVNSRKKYSLDVLLSLKDSAIGREKPTTIPDVCKSLLKSSPSTFVSSARYMGGGRGGGGGGGGGVAGQDNYLLPSFMKGMGFGAPPAGEGSDGGGSGGSSRPPMARNPYRGRLSAKEMSSRSSAGGPGGDDADGAMIKVNVNITEEVKLKGSANAWKPRFMQQNNDVDEETQATQNLSRQFRSALNKLTPENFDVLIEQIKELTIDTEERLNNCIKILFEKAIMEPNFSDTYAKMCKELGDVILVKMNENGKVLNLKRLLISQCQREFETHHQNCKKTSTLQLENDKRNEEGEQTPEQAEEMKLELEEQTNRIRRRALGTIRFIGALYKQEQLRPQIMLQCLTMLLQDDMLDEESLECVCKLLTTIGGRIESSKEPESQAKLQECFKKLQLIADRKTPLPNGETVCNRIRFMIMDVLDLRQEKWIGRHAQVAPKTREQIQREVEKEENKNKLLNFILPRGGGGGGNRHNYNEGGGGGRGGGGAGGGGGGSASKNKRHVDEDGFMLPVGSNRNAWTMPSIDPKKINIPTLKPTEETRLGSASMFQGWSKTNVFASLNTEEAAAPAPSFFGASGPMGGGNSGGDGGASGNSGGGGGGGGGKGSSSHKKGGGGGGGGGNNSKKQHYHGRSSSHF